MNNYFENGDKITLRDKEYSVQEIIGRGSSCVVYKADSTDGNNIEILLKEYNPRYLSLHREKNGAIICPEEKRATYEKGLAQFIKAAKMQANFRKNVDDLKNPTANIQDIIENVNGTCYVIMSVLGGENYSEYKDGTLEELLIRIRSVTKIIGLYHNEGYLHLDIKPDNIFVLREAEKLPILFDFDSVIKKSESKSNLIYSYTKDWAAPEQLSPNRANEICEATDLYAIGEMLFYKLMERHSEHYERRSFSKFEFDTAGNLLKNVNPKIFSVLTEIFNHTICSLVSRRYKTADELIEKLDEAIEIAGQKNYLISNLPLENNTFIGRQKELYELNALLEENGKVFVNGIGGIGKSELAKQYTHTYSRKYDTIIFSMYEGNVDDLILNIPIANFLFPEEYGIQIKEYIERKHNLLRQHCDESTLIVIDNFNENNTKPLLKMLELNCDMLITTRNDFSDENKTQLTITSLSNEEELFELFRQYYRKEIPFEDEMAVREIIHLYSGHTLAIEFLAKQMRASCIDPKEELVRLKNEGFKYSGEENIDTGKDRGLTGYNAYNLMRIVFDTAKLSKAELYVLINLALIPPSGIHKKKFKEWCELETFNIINVLEKSGWLRCDPKTDYISLHPLIADIIHGEVEKDITNCEPMLKAITETFIDGDFDNYDSTRRASLFLINTTISKRIYKFCNLSEICIDFINATAMKFYLYGHVNDYIDYMKHAINASKSIPAFSKEKTAKYFNTLGMLYLYNDKFSEAEKYFKKSLSVKYEVYGEGQHSEIAISLNDMGLLYYNKGQFNDAKQYWEKALKMRLKLYNENHADVAQSYNNMGVLYARLENFDEAEKNYSSAKKVYSALGENKYSDCAVTYCNLGSLYREHGYYDKAKENLLHALLLSKNIHGENHDDTAIVLHALGRLYSGIGNYKLAEINYKKSLDILLKIYGEYHSHTALIYNSLACLYKKINRIKEAAEYYSKVRDIYLTVYGKKHPNTAAIYNNLGGLALSAGKLEEAEKFYLEARDIWVDAYGQNENHANVATVYANLGVVYERQENMKKAIEHFEKALEIKKMIFNANHPDIKIVEDRIKKLKQK